MLKKSKKTLKNKCDKLWSLAVRQRDNYTCQKCKAKHEINSRGLHPHHIFSRRSVSTRFDMDNGITLCFGCHRVAHDKPHDFKDWIVSYLSDMDRYKDRLTWDELREASNEIHKIDYDITCRILESIVRKGMGNNVSKV